MFIERIFSEKMFWEHTVSKAKEIFVRGILRELIGKWYWRPATSATDGSATVKGGIVKNFVIIGEGNMGKWLGMAMKIEFISGFTWKV